jgi:type I restriction enzyme M protein
LSDVTRTTTDIVAKLWNLCHILRDDGITYNEYVTELTFLLFLKMMQETKKEDRLPKEYRWTGLAERSGLDQLEHYRRLLLELGDTKKTTDPLILAIFADAQTKGSSGNNRADSERSLKFPSVISAAAIG